MELPKLGRCPSRKRGVALVAVSLIMVGLAVLSLALFSTVSASKQAQKGSREQINARYITEAGLSVAMMGLSSGADVEEVNLGTEQQPVDFGDAAYWVSAVDLGDDVYELTATGVENGVGSRLELVVREVFDNQFVWAAFGDDKLSMDSNAQVDSYDSSLGSYSFQDVNGNGSNSYARSNGHVGSNGNIHADSNVKVHGDATPGPNGTATVSGNAVVSGATAPSPTVIYLEEIDVPTLPPVGSREFDGSGSGPFNDYIPSGEFHFGEVVVDVNELIIVGPATLVFDSLHLEANSEVIVDETNGGVEIYVLGDFVMDSNTLFAPSNLDPSELEINLLSDNIIDPQQNVDLDYVDFNSNAQLYGTLFAPHASVVINSNFELFGALMARRVHLDSNAKIHFDEALLSASDSEERVFERVAWRHTPYHPD